MPKGSRLNGGSGRSFAKRELKDNFAFIDFAVRMKAETNVELLRTSRPWNVGEFDLVEYAFAANVLDDLM